MARQAQNHTPHPAPAPDGVGQFKLPDPSEFEASPQVSESGDRPGRAVGIDYDRWAVAVIDLDDRADRIAAHRLRLRQKGYKKVEGTPTVPGFPNPECWVKPRNQWERDREARGQKMREAVQRGQLPDSALCHPGIVLQGAR